MMKLIVQMHEPSVCAPQVSSESFVELMDEVTTSQHTHRKNEEILSADTKSKIKRRPLTLSSPQHQLHFGHHNPHEHLNGCCLHPTS